MVTLSNEDELYLNLERLEDLDLVGLLDLDIRDILLSNRELGLL